MTALVPTELLRMAKAWKRNPDAVLAGFAQRAH